MSAASGVSWLVMSLAIACMQMGQKQGAMTGMKHETGPDMDTIHAIFAQSGTVERSVKKLPNGVECTTESSDARVAALIKAHVHAMRLRLKIHQPIRAWDPLFSALFDHAGKIDLKVFETRRGVKIVETSSDPATVGIIHAHAAAVTGFVKEGMAGMARRHEYPPGSRSSPPGFLGKGDGVKTCPVTGEPVNKAIKATIAGKTLYFCCASCIAAVKSKPSLYFRP